MDNYETTYTNGVLRHKQWIGIGSPPNDQPTQTGYDMCGLVEYKRWHDQYKRLHRIDGPAIVFFGHEPNIMAVEHWLIEGETHRIDGPAIIYQMNGQLIREEWYINGNKIKTPSYSSWPLTKEQQIELKLKYS